MAGIVTHAARGAPGVAPVWRVAPLPGAMALAEPQQTQEPESMKHETFNRWSIGLHWLMLLLLIAATSSVSFLCASET